MGTAMQIAEIAVRIDDDVPLSAGCGRDEERKDGGDG
jgi:hypothetical protein